jgi:hypothetical protein
VIWIQAAGGSTLGEELVVRMRAGEQKFEKSSLVTIRIPRTGGLAARPGSCRIIAFETTTYERDS